MASLSAAISVAGLRSEVLGERLSARASSSSSARDLPSLLVQPRANAKPKNAKASPAKGAQALVGYRGSNQSGSAPRRDGKPGKVYRLGPENVDEYSPIFLPNEWSAKGDVYQPGSVGLALWAVTFAGILAVGGVAVYFTSALS